MKSSSSRLERVCKIEWLQGALTWGMRAEKVCQGTDAPVLVFHSFLVQPVLATTRTY